jgi:prolyl oligopeptidase
MRRLPLSLTLVIASCAAAERPLPQRAADAPPSTRTVAQVDTIHGVRVPDPYRWLEDEKSPEVQAWMAAQDDYARDRLRRIPGRDALATRLAQVLYVDSLGAPEHKGSRYFYPRRFATKEKAIIYVRDGRDGPERVLLDPNSWAKDGSDALGGWWPSWDGKLVAYKVRHNNSDESAMHVMDVATGRVLPDVIDGTKYGIASWTPSGDGFYYTWIPSDPAISTADRPGWQTIKFHALGSDARSDGVVVDKIGDPRTFQSAFLSKDGHWLVREVDHGWRSTDLYFRDARKAGSGWTALVERQDALYKIEVHGDRFYLSTNEGAPRWRIFAVDPAHPERAAWKEIVPERKDATLEDASVIGGKLSLLYLKDVISHLEVHELDGKLAREIALPAIGAAGNLVGDEDDDEAYYSFESFTSPKEIWRTSVAAGGAELYFRLSLPVDPSPFLVEQLFATSKDGTRVPFFVVRRKDQKLDGSAQTILTGYGGFLVSTRPVFSAGIYPWLERGGIWVLANLRGGGEYGEEWHRAGMLASKQNVFDDFIAVAEHLLKARYTQPARLAIRGGSNGGLLVGAAETQRPELFAVVLCHVPLIDMVRYHLFQSGKTWISEYGSADDVEVFKAIQAYSPYQHVVPGTKYPATLVLSADADDRVDPLHARKFAAALQAATAGGPVWLRIERHSGHGGADLIKATVEKTADEYAFALQQMGLAPQAVAAH